MNPCVGLSAPKILTFFPMLPSVNKNSEQESSLMLWPLYFYLSGSAFLVSSIEPNKQFKFLYQGFSMYEIYKFNTFLGFLG